MTIDKNTGCVALPEIRAAIAPSLTRSQFLQTAAFSGASVLVQNESWCSYSLPDIPQPDTDLHIRLQFHGQQLSSLDLFHSAPRFGASLSDCTRELEMARKSFHEQWLATELRLSLGGYAWGEVSSDYDPKGGLSSITIRYT
jgi:hypothetical protein